LTADVGLIRVVVRREAPSNHADGYLPPRSAGAKRPQYGTGQISRSKKQSATAALFGVDWICLVMRLLNDSHSILV